MEQTQGILLMSFNEPGTLSFDEMLSLLKEAEFSVFRRKTLFVLRFSWKKNWSSLVFYQQLFAIM